MSATDSDSSEKVAALARNGWPSCSGFGGRHGSELMAVLLRIMHFIEAFSIAGKVGEYNKQKALELSLYYK